MLNDRLKQAEEVQKRTEANRLVAEFQKSHEKGEFRNKLGRVWWPVWHRVVIPAVSGFVVMAGVAAGVASGGLAAVPGVVCGAALWGVGRTVTKGFSVNVQNIAIKNAGIFGRDMTKKQVPEDVKKRAILLYLEKSGALFFNKKYVQKNPSEIEKMAKGEKGTIINNLVALTEYNLTREGNHLQRRKEKVSFKRRAEIYRQSYQTYQANKRQNFPPSRDGGR